METLKVSKFPDQPFNVLPTRVFKLRNSIVLHLVYRLPALIALTLVLSGCEDRAAKERIAGAQEALCSSAIVLQSTGKLTGDSLEVRVARIDEFLAECGSERFREMLEADEDAGIQWVLKQSEESDPPKPTP